MPNPLPSRYKRHRPAFQPEPYLGRVRGKGVGQRPHTRLAGPPPSLPLGSLPPPRRVVIPLSAASGKASLKDNRCDSSALWRGFLYPSTI